MSVYVKTKDGKLKPIREDVTAEEIKKALGYTPADANAVPDVDLSDVEDSDEVFYVTDKNGYIIFKIDKDGIHTTTVNAKEVSLGGSLLLKEHLEDAHNTESKRHVSDEDRKRWNANTAGTDQGITDIENKIDKHIGDDNRHKTAAEQAAIDVSDEGKTFVIVDKDGYKIAEFDAAGLHVIDLLLGASGKSVESLIDEKIGEIDIPEVPEVDLSNYYKKSETYSKDEADTAFMTQTKVDDRINTLIVASDPEGGKTISDIQNLVKYVDENAGEITGLVNDVNANKQAIANMQEEIVSEKDEFHIVDANDNIVATIDKDGVHTTTVTADAVVVNGNDIATALNSIVKGMQQNYVSQTSFNNVMTKLINGTTPVAKANSAATATTADTATTLKEGSTVLSLTNGRYPVELTRGHAYVITFALSATGDSETVMLGYLDSTASTHQSTSSRLNGGCTYSTVNGVWGLTFYRDTNTITPTRVCIREL